MPLRSGLRHLDGTPVAHPPRVERAIRRMNDLNVRKLRTRKKRFHRVWKEQCRAERRARDKL